MMMRKAPLTISGVWQLIRFIAITVSAVFYFNGDLFAGNSLLIIWPASGSLVLFAGYLFASLGEDKFRSLRGLLLFGKVIEIIPGLVLLLLQGGALYLGIARPVFDNVPILDQLTGYVLETSLLFYYGLAVIVLLDLIFLLILLSYKLEPEKRIPKPGENLPELEITHIEED